MIQDQCNAFVMIFASRNIDPKAHYQRCLINLSVPFFYLTVIYTGRNFYNAIVSLGKFKKCGITFQSL